MCGRFVVSWDSSMVAARFGATIVNPLPEKSWNISPTQQIQIVLTGRDGTRRLAGAFWSLVPAWGKTKPLEYPTFNARVESMLEKPTYRDSARSMRAIIPATGYYEWKDHTPHYFHTEGRLLLLAGLYSWWRADANSPWELTATIVTRASEGAPAEIHTRMPLIVADSLVDEWLDPRIGGEAIVPRALAASSAESAKLEIYPVDRLRGDGPELIQPLAQHDEDGSSNDDSEGGESGNERGGSGDESGNDSDSAAVDSDTFLTDGSSYFDHRPAVQQFPDFSGPAQW